jgi:hypothetical protein
MSAGGVDSSSCRYLNCRSWHDGRLVGNGRADVGTEREKRSSTVKVVLFCGGMGMRLRLGAPTGYAKGFFYRKASLDVTIGR